MTANQRIRLAGRIDSLAFSPGGDRAAVAPDGTGLLMLDVSDRELSPGTTLTISTDRPAWAMEVSLKEARRAFLDDETILVARRIDDATSDRSIPGVARGRTLLKAVDARTGAPRRGFEADDFIMLCVDPLPILSRFVVLGRCSKTLALVDTATWEEVSRLCELDEDFDPIADEAHCPEEPLTEGRIGLWTGYGFRPVIRATSAAIGPPGPSG
jgi:hypothetical protein